MQADGVAGRNNSTRNDVIAVEERASNRLTDTVDINRRCRNKGNGEADGSCQQRGNHQDTEPTHINAVIGGGDPIAEGLPATEATTANGGGH